MSKAKLNIKIETKLKKDAKAICEEMGISLEDALNIYLKTIVRENRIPFEVKADPFYNPNDIKYLENKLKKYKEAN